MEHSQWYITAFPCGRSMQSHYLLSSYVRYRPLALAACLFVEHIYVLHSPQCSAVHGALIAFPSCQQRSRYHEPERGLLDWQRGGGDRALLLPDRTMEHLKMFLINLVRYLSNHLLSVKHHPPINLAQNTLWLEGGSLSTLTGIKIQS